MLRKAGKEVITQRPLLYRAKTKGKEGANQNGNWYKGQVFINSGGRRKIEEERLTTHLKKLEAEEAIKKGNPAEPVDSILNIATSRKKAPETKRQANGDENSIHLYQAKTEAKYQDEAKDQARTGVGTNLGQAGRETAAKYQADKEAKH